MPKKTPGIKLPRRAVLKGAGAASMAALLVNSGEVQAQSKPASAAASVGSVRRAAARDIRSRAAEKATEAKTPTFPTLSADSIAEWYSKGLKRRPDGDMGLPTEQAFDALQDVIRAAYQRMSSTGLQDDFYAIENLQAHLDEEDRFKLTNPLGGLAFDLEGPDSFATFIKDPPEFSSAQTAAEMAELYWMALFRDRQLADFGPDTTDPEILKAIDDLNTYSWIAGNARLTKERLFRADLRDGASQNAGFEGVDKGPYVSQFLLRGTAVARVMNAPPNISQRLGLVTFGTLSISQRQRTTVPNTDFLTDAALWRRVQNGERAALDDDIFDLNTPTMGDASTDRAVEVSVREKLRFISTLRDGATYVHFDKIYQEYLVAACILLSGLQRGRIVPAFTSNEFKTLAATPPPEAPEEESPVPPIAEFGEVGPMVLNVGNPYRHAGSQVGFATFGVTHFVTLLAEVSTRAHKAGWYHKWRLARLRPEEYGGRVQKTLTGGPQYRLHSDLTRKQADGSPVEALKRIIANTGTYYLPMAFPEGSPTHPAYPSGHATIAGACVTMLKAIFNETFVMTNNPQTSPQVPAYVGHGETLAEAYAGIQLTVGGELNKLASNVTAFRSFAGVHWRSDNIDGMLLGEQVALEMLVEQTQPAVKPSIPFYRERPRQLGAGQHPYGGAPFFRLSLFNGKAFDVVDGEIRVLDRSSADSSEWTPTGDKTTIAEIVANYRK